MKPADDPAKQLRAVKRELRELTNGLLVYLGGLDKMVAHRHDVPRDVSAWLGKCANSLEMLNDSARYFGLGINWRTDDKAKAREVALRALLREIGDKP